MGLAAASIIVGCAPPRAGEAPKRLEIKAHPEFAGVRLYVPPKAELTWTDSDCAAKAGGLAAEFMLAVAGKLSHAGFTVVSDPAGADAKVSLRANLTYCGEQGVNGPGSLGIEPGAVVSGPVGFRAHAAFSDSQFWEFILVKQLIEAPQVLALAQKRAEPKAVVAQGAEPKAVVAQGAEPAETPKPPVEAATDAAVRAPAPSPALASGAQQANAFAMVVGIEKYRDAPAPPGARADAEAFKALATKTLGVPAANVRLLVDDRASKTDIERELAWLKANVPQDGKVIFFFAGHGAPDASNGTSYLLPYDGSPDALGQTGVPLASVMKSLGETKAKQVVAFVDACFSGAGGRSVLPKGARALVRVKELLPQARVALFAAASGAQTSGPTADGKSGLFTRLLGDGIGSGQADIDGDGNLTLEEIAQWVTPRVTREAQRQSREQKPSLTVPANAGSSSFVLATGVAR